MSTFYTLRYLPGTALKDRKHQFTQVQASTWAEAEDARLAVPHRWGDLLEVVERGQS
jgi:hypothetical protein